MRKPTLRLPFLMLSTCATAAFAQSEALPESSICDVSAPVFECRVTPQLEGDTLLLVSDAPSCSLVEWLLDGEKRTTLIVDQGTRVGTVEDPPQRSRALRRRVTVSSCVQVADSRVDPASYEAARRYIPPSLRLTPEERRIESMDRAEQARLERGTRQTLHEPSDANPPLP